MPEKQPSPLLRRLSKAAWTVGLAVVIFAASGQSEVAAPSCIPDLDKLAHFLVFGLLATLTVRAIFRPDRRFLAMVIAVLLVSLYGALDELRQSFTPGRSVEVADWVADTSGALLAAALYCFWPGWRRLLEWMPGRWNRHGEMRLTPAPAGAGDLGTK